eukprot:1813574-Amphidinium_carterae.1
MDGNATCWYQRLAVSQPCMLTLRKLNGEHLRVACRKDEIVADVKRKVSIKHSIPGDQQILVSEGRYLQDHMSLASYGLTPHGNYTVDLVIVSEPCYIEVRLDVTHVRARLPPVGLEEHITAEQWQEFRRTLPRFLTCRQFIRCVIFLAAALAYAAFEYLVWIFIARFLQKQGLLDVRWMPVWLRSALNEMVNATFWIAVKV